MEMVALSTGISIAYLCQMILSDARANLTWRANAGLFALSERSNSRKCAKVRMLI